MVYSYISAYPGQAVEGDMLNLKLRVTNSSVIGTAPVATTLRLGLIYSGVLLNIFQDREQGFNFAAGETKIIAGIADTGVTAWDALALQLPAGVTGQAMVVAVLLTPDGTTELKRVVNTFEIAPLSGGGTTEITYVGNIEFV